MPRAASSKVSEGRPNALAAGAPHVVVEVIPQRPGERARGAVLEYMRGLGYEADAPAGDVVFTPTRIVTREGRRADAPAASR